MVCPVCAQSIYTLWYVLQLSYNVNVMKIVITGGHHSSALPLIEYIREKGLNIDIVWFGHAHSMRGNKNPTLEYKQITSRNIPFIDLKAGKFYKTFSPVRIAKIPFGFIQSFFLLLRYKPDVVLSFGGYLAVPVVFVAKILGIPTITHEQTLVTGYANKFISRFADKILISHEESRKYFPSDKVVYSGLPLRKSLFTVKTSSFKFDNELPVLYITAGKTGSHKINQAIQKCLLPLLKNYNIIHQCGGHSRYEDFDSLNKAFADISNLVRGEYYLRKFVYDNEIGEVFTKADIFLSRGGAHTTYEIKTFGKPCILVPIPWVSHDEQNINAQILVDLGLAKILTEDELTCENVITSLEEAKKKIPLQSESPIYNNKPQKVMLSQIRSLYEKKKAKKV